MKKPAPFPSRRSFLTVLWTGLGIAAIAEFIAVIISFLSPGKTREKSSESGAIIEAGHADKFPLNSVTANIQGRFYLCRMEDGGFLAVSSKCTHLGCTVPWMDKEKRFACPCHGSSFDITGNVMSPPASRPLDTYLVYIENNIVKVDISKTIEREKFLEEQAAYTKKVSI
ncbi:MAG: ubiquinol-cytochrome c reductase iron-sulfur subunit [Deltaproteobacteria bacterium]|nr:ubiquinol-cytochrome c reductase iron-sulfur subunit [Deltaproteobacteria bacterium]